ncbi:MAG: metallophosphoesterase family protein, partial [Candidatus Sifarchaeia archaeon]
MDINKPKSKKRTRIFFATDIHGSERCFKKFIKAGEFYKADVLILGGDISGKSLIPMIEDNGIWTTIFSGSSYSASSNEELEDVEKKVRAAGFYPYRTNKQEVEELNSNPEKLKQLFEELMLESMKRWMKLAGERLKGSEVKCFVSAGNCDIYAIDPILGSSDIVFHSDEKIVKIDELNVMLSIGKSNMTPWECPRDVSEDELAKRIEELASQVNDMKRCIFNIHVPPFGTGIDEAPELDENLKPKLSPGGGTISVPVGSKAVREAIEKYQPRLAFHGHIHESKGYFQIGKTKCFNPGSEYSEGILRG